jgi:hypothetical protein
MTKYILPTLFVASLLSSCASTSMKSYSDDVAPGSLRLIQVIDVASRADMLQGKIFYEELIRTGISDSDIHDGSMVVGRIYCCGGSAELPTRQYAYVPLIRDLQPLDIVEIQSGFPPANKERGTVNRVTRVVQKANVQNGQCRWIPPDPGLWMRVLYCDWMKSEGWIEQTGWNHTWLKPPANQDSK